MQDERLLKMWFDFLSMFQGMNVNIREMESHIEFEPNTYYAAFSAELEASASPMWALVHHLKVFDLTIKVGRFRFDFGSSPSPRSQAKGYE